MDICLQPLSNELTESLLSYLGEIRCEGVCDSVFCKKVEHIRSLFLTCSNFENVSFDMIKVIVTLLHCVRKWLQNLYMSPYVEYRQKHCFFDEDRKQYFRKKGAIKYVDFIKSQVPPAILKSVDFLEQLYEEIEDYRTRVLRPHFAALYSGMNSEQKEFYDQCIGVQYKFIRPFKVEPWEEKPKPLILLGEKRKVVLDPGI